MASAQMQNTEVHGLLWSIRGSRAGFEAFGVDYRPLSSELHCHLQVVSLCKDKILENEVVADNRNRVEQVKKMV